MFNEWKPNFKKVRKIDGEWWVLEEVSRDREQLLRRGKDLKKLGYTFTGPITDYRLVDREVSGREWYGLYVLE